MFELVCLNSERIQFNDKDGNRRTFYRLWFNLPSGGLGWLTSNVEYSAGTSVPIEIYIQGTSDTRTNMRLGLRVAST